MQRALVCRPKARSRAFSTKYFDEPNYRPKGKRVEKVGGYVFFRFVLPLVRHVSSLIGARLICLYALPVPRLIRYYETLGFRRLDTAGSDFVYGRVKPKYDQGCVFMFRGL